MTSLRIAVVRIEFNDDRNAQNTGHSSRTCGTGQFAPLLPFKMGSDQFWLTSPSFDQLSKRFDRLLNGGRGNLEQSAERLVQFEDEENCAADRKRPERQGG